MTPEMILAIFQMVMTAEPVVVQTVHDLLVGAGGKSDQAVLTQDVADWDAIIAKAKVQIGAHEVVPPAAPPVAA